MPPTLTSSRDREVLRSFARRIDPSDAGAHNNLGVLYYNKGLYEEAVSAFMRALELDPKMQVAQRNLEIAYFHTGYYDRRVPELKERLRVRPHDRAARWELARTFAHLGQLGDAVAHFTALLQHHPDDLGALMQLGLAEKANGRFEQALGWLERARTLDPGSSVVHFYIGEILYNRGLNDEALAALRRAIELAPENPDALYLMGFVLGDLGRHEEAQEVTQRAIKLNPTLSRAQTNLSLDQYRPDRYEAMVSGRQEKPEVVEGQQLAHYNLGLAFRQKGYYAEALREYRLATERGEDRDLVLQAMAEVHLLRREPRAALELYERLLESQPDSPKLWNERGIALHQEGRAADAAESYRRSVAREAGYALAHNNLGVALYHLGDLDGAVGCFRAALEAQPTFVKSRLNLALLLTKGRRLPLALEAYRQVLQVEPEQPVAWNGVGLVLSEMKQFVDARNAFARAIDGRPDYAEAHYNLSFTLSNLGDFEGALRETKRALELDPYYVAQKFELAIDLEYEDPDLAIVPELDAERRTGDSVADFAFESQQLDKLFVELAPPPPAAPAAPVETTPYAMAADYLSKGLFERGAAEVSRALARGAPRLEGLTLLGDAFARQGLHGEALERYREARQLDADHAAAMLGEAWALLRLKRAAEARPVAEGLLRHAPHDLERLMLAATARAETGDPAAALEALDVARRVAPMRADVHQKIGDIAQSLGDVEGAIASYRHSLQLDHDVAAVRYRLARLLLSKGHGREAEQELLAALDAVPTYAEAMLELSALRRRAGRPQDALNLLVDLLHQDPYHLESLLVLGETLLELAREEDALVAFTRVLRFDGTNVKALYHRGVLLARRRRFREAIECWKLVVAHEPGGELGHRARREMRSAEDLQQIMKARLAREESAAPGPGPSTNGHPAESRAPRAGSRSLHAVGGD
ncbi:MAG TPA: tetratricopeptide repeat protein [Gemmatimonadaceae bacterium]|nr:tetratricopeptide repeat protein [Gemmatimonadaceae bacterium]